MSRLGSGASKEHEPRGRQSGPGRIDTCSAYEIILGTLLGGLLGFSVRKVMQFAERRNYIDRQSFVAQYVSLALMSTGGTVLLGSDDLL